MSTPDASTSSTADQSLLWAVLSDARTVAAKDLRLELRSKVGLGQVLPFSILVLLLFGFALDGEAQILTRVTPGLFWMTVLFSDLLIVQRSFAAEADPGVGDALRLSGLHPAGIFLGKVAAVSIQLWILELVVLAGTFVLYSPKWTAPALMVAVMVTATIGISAASCTYGLLSASNRVKDTLLPMLLLPAMSPLLIAAAKSFDSAIAGAVSGWSWVALLGVFALSYCVLGAAVYRPLLEEL